MKNNFSIQTAVGLCILSAVLTACAREPGEPPATERAVAELKEKYAELRKQYEELDKGEDAVSWAKEDLENIGDWEYRIVELASSDVGELESGLNELGDDRWEVFWVERRGASLLLMLKRPAISYISRMPFSELGRIVGDGQ